MSVLPQPKPITVSIYFGKKDNILLYLLYEDVSSGDFNFIVKAALKHYINHSLFHIHHYINLERIIELYEDIQDNDDFEFKKQRNIQFIPRDDFVYDWLNTISESKRPQEIKEIVVSQLKKCIDLYKNPPSEDDKVQPQFVVVPNLSYQDISSFNQIQTPNNNLMTQTSKQTEVDMRLNSASIQTLKSLQGNPIGQLGKQ